MRYLLVNHRKRRTHRRNQLAFERAVEDQTRAPLYATRDNVIYVNFGGRA